MSATFRYWCGECGYKTPWLDEWAGAEELERHYLRRHPGIEPGGDFEIRRGDGQGCLGTVAVPFLLLRRPDRRR
ncbi:hypothetical protein [Amycolatopsis cihanbeyliensis]|uniref:Uncharacterized protein n=1 Tax=Amycolatopsis cihanbeyliensis TaxID=1128664 RepID=A0A542DD16_AMYCI|nr:hypothetical protein [Amycolatopsis cihanbeyliensis]TQJ00967.1 hypothetical protein FB471_0622 [Amycolatopsis cihanbeyliensis]